MGNYLDKWKTLFPEVVGGTKRPLEAISDQDEFNTNGFPQFIAQDPVRYDLQNAFLKQFLSNDAWLWVRQQQADQALDRHKDDAQAHPNGVSGNAASATKLQTARSLNLGGAVTADAATFDGTADTTINVKTLDATKLKGTASVSTTGNAATATKLKTPRTLSLTGKAAGSATFDGAANASINVTSVNADTASKATQDGAGNVITNTYLKKAGDTATGDLTAPNFKGHLAGNADTATADKYGTDIADNYVRKYVNVGEQDLNNFRYGGLYCNPMNSAATSARHYPKNEAGSLLVLNNGANGVDGCTQIYTTYATHDSYKREYDVASKTWSDWRKYAFEDSTVARALIADNLNSGANTGSITIYQSGCSDYSPTVGGNYANMNISSWFGVSFTSQCGGTVPKGKTAVGIDCREGIVRARSFEGALNGTATNADTVDGYHASDLLRTLGGNRTPVITDIFDRAGTIDMSTMSAADKATHKANINKAPNMVQNLWNDACGIYAYGGDTDINGYYRGTLKLTQSYKKFDKLMIILTDDNADWELVRMFDVYEFNYCMTSLHSFSFLENSIFWYVYGLTKQGTDASFKPSTETVLSCRSQNCGIIGIYGIKY